MIKMLIAIEICSLLYSILVGIVYLTKKKTKNTDSKIYGVLMIITILGFITEIFNNMCPSLFGIESSISRVVANIYKSHYVLYTSLLMTYMLIKSYYSKETDINKRKNHLKKVLISMSIYSLILLLVIIIPKSEPHFDLNANAYWGTGISIIPIIIAAFITEVLNDFFLIKNFKKLNSNQKTSHISIALLILTGGVVRFINPAFTINNTIFSLCTIILFFTIENPTIKEIDDLEGDTENKDSFFKGISSEIKPPINKILDLSSNTTHELEEMQNNMKLINQESSSLLETINNVLDSKNFDENQISNVNEKYSLKDAIAGIIEECNTKLADSEVRFRYEYSSLIPQELIGNKDAVVNIVTKLLHESLKYVNTSGYIILDLSYQTTFNMITISVKFSNNNLPEEIVTAYKELITDNISSKEVKNVDKILGIVLVKNYSEALEGNISFNQMESSAVELLVKVKQEPAPVEAASVDPYLSAPKSEETNAQEETTNNETTTSPLSSSNSENRVLIVDDNTLNIKVAQKILERLGFEVESALSADEGISMIKTKSYRHIFMDIMMPVKDGVQALHEIRTLDGGNKLHIIALTADNTSGTREKYLKEGFDEYIGKPVNQVEMERVTRK